MVEHSESVRFDMFLLFELNARCLKVWGHDVKTWLYDDDGRRHWGLHANEQVAFFFFNIYFSFVILKMLISGRPVEQGHDPHQVLAEEVLERDPAG